MISKIDICCFPAKNEQVLKDLNLSLGFRNRHENVFKDLALEQLPNIDFFGLLENKILTIT